MIRYLAIFEQANGDRFVIEYRPCYDEIAGGIEVISVDFQPRPVSPFQQRQAERRKPRRGYAPDEVEQAAEAMRPYNRVENAF